MRHYPFNFDVIWRNWERILDGLWLSLQLAVGSIAIGVLIGLGLALIHVSGNRFARTLVNIYVEAIRNVPLLLLVYLVFYGLPKAIDIQYSATTSFIGTLALYSGAYLVEVFRSGLQAIPRGLTDAGKAIGLTPFQRLVSVRLPLMFRIVLPALSNTFVSLFKDTSLATVIAIPELTNAAQYINNNTFRVIEAYAIVTPLYLLTGWAILLALRQLEKRYAIR